MCRYAFKIYKTHFVCFDCRKTFKKSAVEDLASQNGDWKDYKKAFWYYSREDSKKFRKENPQKTKYLEDKYINRKEKCPDCGNLMADLGLDFKAPKKEKVKEWKIVQGLLRIGINFHTCGCHGIGYVPSKPQDFLKYLLNKREYYEQRLVNRDVKLSNEDIKDYFDRFTELIQLIDIELKNLKVNIRE